MCVCDSFAEDVVAKNIVRYYFHSPLYCADEAYWEEHTGVQVVCLLVGTKITVFIAQRWAGCLNEAAC